MVRVRLPLLYRGCPRLPTVALRKPASAAPSSPLRGAPGHRLIRLACGRARLVTGAGYGIGEGDASCRRVLVGPIAVMQKCAIALHRNYF